MTVLQDLILILIIWVLVQIGAYLWTRHDQLEDQMPRYNCNLALFEAGVPDRVRAECIHRLVNRYNQLRQQQFNQDQGV